MEYTAVALSGLVKVYQTDISLGRFVGPLFSTFALCGTFDLLMMTRQLLIKQSVTYAFDRPR